MVEHMQAVLSGPVLSSEVAGELGRRDQPLVLAEQQVLPVTAAFEDLLPDAGLRRGTVTRINGPGATSLALALLAGCTTQGSWVAAVGLQGLGLEAAGELGLALERLLLVDVPSPDQWSTAVAAALDGMDAVLVELPRSLARGSRESDVRRLQSRLRDRGAVVVLVGAAGAFQPDLVFSTSAPSWQGLGAGWGHLRSRCIPVEVTGRRAASRPRIGRLWLPDEVGQVRLEPSPVVPLRAGAAG
jgi:hypothetical protein